MTVDIQNEGRARIRAFLVVAFMALAAVVAASAQDVIKIETELAAFEVSVTDRDGKPVTGLDASAFKIFENGEEKEIAFFQPLIDGEDRRPMLVVFALDVSGSLTPAELEKLRSAMDQFIDRLAHPHAYFAVTTFAMNVKRRQAFTNRTERVRRAMANIERDRDGLSTHAYDAVDDAVRLIARNAPKAIRGERPKRAVVVITDGFPVGDVVAPSTVIERANDAGVSVYSIILPSFSRLSAGDRPLLTPFEATGLVRRTGGVSLYANEGSLDGIFRAMAEQIAASYAIAYYPEESAEAGNEFREVRIEAGKELLIKQNRPGFRLGEIGRPR
ncbi:MAG TPA: VWA domain-containing protein [Pyrinomonadaceae bacterium]|nr:VWA domain-containing protein [Pyrinomonadaceae bacterium]